MLLCPNILTAFLSSTCFLPPVIPLLWECWLCTSILVERGTILEAVLPSSYVKHLKLKIFFFHISYSSSPQGCPSSQSPPAVSHPVNPQIPPLSLHLCSHPVDPRLCPPQRASETLSLLHESHLRPHEASKLNDILAILNRLDCRRVQDIDLPDNLCSNHLSVWWKTWTAFFNLERAEQKWL